MTNISKRLNTRKGSIAAGDSGFTLVELLITVVIIAILTAIAIPAYISVVTNAQVSAAKQNISSVLSAEDLYYSAPATTGKFADAGKLTSEKLIKIDATKTVVLLNDTSTAGKAIGDVGSSAAVGAIADNGDGYVSSTADRTPAIVPAVKAAVGAAAKLAALNTAVQAAANTP